MPLVIPTSWRYSGGAGAVGVNGSRISLLSYKQQNFCGLDCASYKVHHLSRSVAIMTPGCLPTIALGATFTYWGLSSEFTTNQIDALKDLLIRDTPTRNGRVIIGVNNAVARRINGGNAPFVDT